MKIEQVKISQLKSNTGQIEGLPANPRLIKDERFKKLVKSIQDDPEMLDLRELIVFPHEENFVVIAGNMRLKAMKELGFKEAPCKILSEETPIEKLRAYTIKDNVGFGDHDFDLLANEWNLQELTDWGLELPEIDELDLSDKNKEINIDDLDTSECKIVFKFDALMYESVSQRIRKLKEDQGFETNEVLLLELLQKYES
jgi:ParB-like chromosome segregation protein Spo0J